MFLGQLIDSTFSVCHINLHTQSGKYTVQYMPPFPDSLWEYFGNSILLTAVSLACKGKNMAISRLWTYIGHHELEEKD